MNWHDFYTECESYALAGADAEIQIKSNIEKLLWSKWHVGVLILKEGPRYGDKVVDRLAQDFKAKGIQGYDRSELFKCQKFAGRYGLPEVQELIDRKYSWQ